MCPPGPPLKLPVGVKLFVNWPSMGMIWCHVWRIIIQLDAINKLVDVYMVKVRIVCVRNDDA